MSSALSKVPEVTKSNIKAADMDKEMIQQAIDTSRLAISKYEIEVEIAQFIKEHFDRTY